MGSIDFELGMTNAFAYVFPNVEVHRCLFHLSQNVYRRAQNLCLQERYVTDAELAIHIRMLISIIRKFSIRGDVYS